MLIDNINEAPFKAEFQAMKINIIFTHKKAFRNYPVKQLHE